MVGEPPANSFLLLYHLGFPARCERLGGCQPARPGCYGRRGHRGPQRRGPGCLLMAIFQGDLYVGGCREHSGPFLVWHEAFSWTLDQLAARPEADKAPPSHDHLLTLVRDLTRRLAPGRRRNRFWALPRAWLQRLRRAGLRLSGSSGKMGCLARSPKDYCADLNKEEDANSGFTFNLFYQDSLLTKHFQCQTVLQTLRRKCLGSDTVSKIIP